MVAGMDLTPTRIRRLLGLAAPAACGVLLASPAYANHFDFDLVRTNGLPPGCARGATAHVHVDTSPGFTERLVLTVRGFKPCTLRVLFTLQVPNAPFGVGWYQGDVGGRAQGLGEGDLHHPRQHRDRGVGPRGRGARAAKRIPARTPSRTRSSSGSTPTISASGSIGWRPPRPTAARRTRRRSTATTPPARRCSTAAGSRTRRGRCRISSRCEPHGR